MQPYIYTCRLGAITLSIISEGTLQLATDRIFAGVDEALWRPLVDTDAAGRFTCGLNVVYVRAGEHSILLDTGMGEPHPLRSSFETSYAIAYTAPLLSSLASLGVSPEQITTVVFSHTHFDHIMGATLERDGQRVPSFPRARYLLSQEEWTGSPDREQPYSAFNLHLPVLQEHNCLELISGEYEIAPGIRMIPAPGESPGHAIIRMESEGKTAFYLGDLFHHPAEVTHLDWTPRFRDRERLFASRKALVQEALVTDALLISAHMLFPGMGKLRQHQEGLEWVAIKPDTKGWRSECIRDPTTPEIKDQGQRRKSDV